MRIPVAARDLAAGPVRAQRADVVVVVEAVDKAVVRRVRRRRSSASAAAARIELSTMVSA